MSAFPASQISAYTEPDLATLLQSIPSHTTARKSITLEEDKSQPPTPDGSGLPVNFQIVGPHFYRASYPQAAHFSALVPLKLRTIITLVGSTIPADYAAFMTDHGITHHHLPILANKDPDNYSPDSLINEVLTLLLDRDNYPLLVHCNNGKHRTGCVVACFRTITGWTNAAVVAEYEHYSYPKSRQLDRDFIARFDASVLKPLALERGFVGGAFAQTARESSKDSVYTQNTYVSDDSTLSYEPLAGCETR
jgi:protein tyrosine/serine phosphatase